MSRNTNIQWCDSTVNPVMGCDGCELWSSTRRTCYAGVLHRRYSRNKGYADNFDRPQLFPGRMAEAAKWKPLQLNERPTKPWLNGLPRLIFVSDMGDALSSVASFDYLREEIVEVAQSPKGRRHRWLWLTKRPARMRTFNVWLSERGVDWPSNLWPMTSVTGRATQRRVSSLCEVGPKEIVRGVSFEPLVDEPDWDACLGTGVGWAIFGGESGANARPLDADVLRRGLDACRERGIAAFLKQTGAQPVGLTIDGAPSDGHGGDWDQWREEFRVREVPRDTVIERKGSEHDHAA